jgi:hypothetical protein
VGVELTTALLNRLWDILENGQNVPPLVLVGNRLKRQTTQGWLKEEMIHAPRDFPQLDIEVGRRGGHSAYTKAPTFAIEAADNAGMIDWEIDRVETVVITTKTDRVEVGGINQLKECILDDIMASGPRLGLPELIVGFGPFTHEQRYTRRGEIPKAGQITTITFPVVMLQHGHATLIQQE